MRWQQDLLVELSSCGLASTASAPLLMRFDPFSGVDLRERAALLFSWACERSECPGMQARVFP